MNSLVLYNCNSKNTKVCIFHMTKLYPRGEANDFFGNDILYRLLGLGNDKGSFVATPPIRRGPFVDPTIIKLKTRVCNRTIYKES